MTIIKKMLCPKCGKLLRIPASLGGRLVRCAKCKEEFIAPVFTPFFEICVGSAHPQSAANPAGPSTGKPITPASPFHRFRFFKDN
jgi:hypothetical protein